MTDRNLTTVLKEAEHYDQVARTTDNQAHEYLRYAILRVPEGESEGCKHLRRVDHEIKRDRVPRPDGRLPSP